VSQTEFHLKKIQIPKGKIQLEMAPIEVMASGFFDRLSAVVESFDLECENYDFSPRGQ